MSWLKQAAMALNPGFKVLSIHDYQLYQGLQFADLEEAKALFFDYKAVGESLELSISSQLNNKPRFHYKARLVLAKQLESKSTGAWFENENPESGEPFYQNGALFHGKALQTISQVLAFSEQGIKLLLKPSATAAIAINDSVYQAALVYSFKQLGLGSLPMATKCWRFFNADPGEVYIELKRTQQKGHKLVFDAQVFNQDQQLLADISEVEMASKEGLTEQFLQKK